MAAVGVTLSRVGQRGHYAIGSQQSETVLGGGGTGDAAEGAVEIRLIGVAQFVRDVDEPDMRITYEVGRNLEASLVDNPLECQSILFQVSLEGTHAHARDIGDFFDTGMSERQV